MNTPDPATHTDPSGFIREADAATKIRLITPTALEELRNELSETQRLALQRSGFAATTGQFTWLDDEAGAHVLAGWDGNDTLATLGALPLSLPEGDYCLGDTVSELQLLGWGLGSYQFNRYRRAKRQPARLVVADDDRFTRLIDTTRAVALCRDLINTPAQDMAPAHLEAELTELADVFGATIAVTTGDELLDLDCGAIHAVGRAATDAPRLIDLQWGDPAHPKVTLVGKGVTFDSGGLDIKPASGMRTMKKDMGGAANAIGLAYLIMAQALPISLRLLIPAAENAIAGNAFRPGDILQTHKGLTVEIDNTDAEGRLLLCDALSIACADEPELIVEYATLTGSARAAVGTEIAAMFSNSDALAEGISESATHTDDPVWRMPLHGGYGHMLDSKIADLVNCAPSPYAGAITAALFLERFVDDVPWVHFDIMAFNTRSRAAHPEGGEAMALRAVFDYLQRTYGEAQASH